MTSRSPDRAKVVGYGPNRIVLGEGVRGGGSVFVLLDVFGELALLDGRPRSATVIAASDILTARLSRTAFLDLVRSDPDIALRVMEGLATRLRECQGNRAL
jgi:CRP-like cAMP-binding protein